MRFEQKKVSNFFQLVCHKLTANAREGDQANEGITTNEESLFDLGKHDHQPLSRPPQAPPHPGNHSPRHRWELQRRHRPEFNQVCEFVQTDEDTSVLVKVTLGRQTVRKCGLSRPDGEKENDFHISQMICILTNCVLACVSQKLGDQGPKNKDAKDSIDISADKNFNLISLEKKTFNSICSG